MSAQVGQNLAENTPRSASQGEFGRNWADSLASCGWAGLLWQDVGAIGRPREAAKRLEALGCDGKDEPPD